MKPYSKLATLGLAAVAALLLSACGKTSNSGSDTATTPSATCTVQADGTLRNSAGTVCTAGTLVCPATGYYVNSQTGQQTACTPGTTVSINNGYPYGTNPTQYTSGCQYWTNYYQQQGYNVQYVPMILNGQYVCVNYSWLNQYSQGTAYQDNYDYYYQYPPYSYTSGQTCNTSVALSYGSFSGSVCF